MWITMTHVVTRVNKKLAIREFLREEYKKKQTKTLQAGFDQK